MNARHLSRRVAPPATSAPIAFLCPPLPSLPFRPASQCQRRHASGSWFGFRKGRDESDPPPGASRSQATNPLLADYLKKKPSIQQNQRMPTQGSLSKSSIFEDEHEMAGAEDEGDKGRDLHAMKEALDPQPNARKRWEAKVLMREVRRRGRMSRTQVIKQTERSHTSTSPMMKTSVKKLGMLARQIAGKSLDDAVTQMRFSAKKVAQGVLEHLEYSRNRAIVTNGMALGAVKGESHDTVMIRDKEGNRIKVTDPTSLYIDQAWVNRGTYGLKPEYRARGRTNVLRLPYTSLTVVLKEEATRVRQHKEREAKEANKKIWVAMPDRPITAQHQYPLW